MPRDFSVIDFVNSCEKHSFRTKRAICLLVQQRRQIRRCANGTSIDRNDGNSTLHELCPAVEQLLDLSPTEMFERKYRMGAGDRI
jgi:hypothetical protein